MSQLDLAAMQTIADHALEEWDLDATKVELASISENLVYRVETQTEKSYALRIHRVGYHTFAELISELQWTDALSRAGIDVPSPVMTRNGDGYATVPVPGTNETRYVGVIEWLDGVLLGTVLKQKIDAKSRNHYFAQLGRITARMHNHACAWQLPEGFERVAWDADGFMGDTPLWGAFWAHSGLTAAERSHILDIRRTIHDRLLEYGTGPDRFSLIHADMNPDNVIVHKGKVSPIDFDDAGFGWHIYDLAVSLSYELETAHFEEVRDAMIEAYRSERPLDHTAVELLPMFSLIRELIMLGWLHDRPEYQDKVPLSSRIQRVTACAEAL
jgi:Ser/Thr protein kinase RdoA (MazF antagonist)